MPEGTWRGQRTGARGRRTRPARTSSRPTLEESVRAFLIEVSKSAHRLGNVRKKSVQDACCQVRIKARCSRAPSGSAKGYGCEQEQYWQSAKVG